MLPRSTIVSLFFLLASAPVLAQEAPPVPAAPPLQTQRQTELDAVGLTPPTVMSEGHVVTAEEVMVSTILGRTLYTGVEETSEVIGVIKDLVVGPLGDISAAIVDIGGFLGTGQKDVAVAFAEIERVPGPDGQVRWVLQTTREALAAAPVFQWPDENAVPAAPTSEAEEAEQLVEDPNATAVDPELTTDQAETGAQTTPDSIETTEPTPEELVGMGVYGLNDQPIGTINSVIETENGDIDAIVVDVGGFLGLGAKPVAVAYENLTFSTDRGGVRYLFLNTTRDALEAQPMYDPGTYAENREEQRMIVEP